MIDVVWLSLRKTVPAHEYWDQTLLDEVFKGLNITNHDSVEGLTGAIVVIPGAYQSNVLSRINKELKKLEWCIVVITSDEENNFPIDSLKHDNMLVFANYYNKKYKKVDYWLPIGVARRFKTNFVDDKEYNWSFSGQVNHEARRQYVKELKRRTDGLILRSKGFGKGLDHDEYYELLSKSKIIPAPRGNISPDSFRLYEAIESGAVPIPQHPEFWQNVFDNTPFPIITDYEQINGYIDDVLKLYPEKNNKTQEWWLHQKRKIKEAFIEAYEDLSGKTFVRDFVTAIVPVSPIKSHPDTVILDETIRSIRYHFPDIEIILTFDGVRSEQEDKREDYEKFKQKVLWKCFNEDDYKNINPLIFDSHTHQVGMAKKAMELVNTPLILYVEQDTPLVTDEPIDWANIVQEMFAGKSNLVRFHFEARIPKEHRHMVHGMDARTKQLMMTSQWSQRPHIATTAFYRRILNDYFTENANSFIEDKMHGVVATAYEQDGMLGWEQFRIHIYHPGSNIKRSYHTDGRAGEKKYDDTQIF